MNSKLLKYDIFIVFLLVFILRYIQIFLVPYANGWDGCFYEMQMHCWLNSGQMHSENYSLIYLLIKPIAWISNPEYSYKLVATIAAVLFSVFIYEFVKKEANRTSAIAALLLTVASPIILFISHQFTKNLLGIDVIILFFLVDQKWWRSLLIVALAFFTHRIAFAFLIAYLCTDYLLSKKLKYVAIISAVGIGSIVLLSVIPGMPNIFDYLRLSNENWFTFYWTPASFLSSWGENSLGITWYTDIIIMHAILIAGTILAFKQKKNIAIALLILTFIIPIFKWETGGMAYRLFFNAFCLMFLIIPPILRNKKTQIVLIVIGVCMLPLSIFSYNAKLFDPPVEMYRALANEAVEKINTNKPVLVIAHKGIKEQVILQSDYDALNWLPNNYTDSISYYRIVKGVSDNDIIRYVGKEQSEWIKLQSGYFVTTERNWRNYIQALNEEGEYNKIKELETWLNPYSKRPQFLQ